MPDASMHPQPCVRKIKCTQASHHRFTGCPGIPCAMVFGFLRALLGEPGFLATIIGAMRQHFADLISASGYQDHTTSPSASNALRLAHRRRPPHPAPNVRDDRDTPLVNGRGTRGDVPVICPSSQAHGLRPIGTTGKSARRQRTGNLHCQYQRRCDLRSKSRPPNPLASHAAGAARPKFLSALQKFFPVLRRA